MNVSVFKNVVSTVTRVASAHSPAILAGIAVVGVIGTAVCAIRDTHRATVAEVEFGAECPENITDEEYSRKAALVRVKCYIPTVVMAGCTIACIVAGSATSARRIATIAGLYEASDILVDKYKDEISKLEKPVAEKIENAVNDYVSPEKVAIVKSEDGSVRVPCVDMFGREFMCSENEWYAAQNKINHMINMEYRAMVNDLYDILKQPDTDAGGLFEWNSEHMLDVTFGNRAKVINGIPMVYLDYGCVIASWL